MGMVVGKLLSSCRCTPQLPSPNARDGKGRCFLGDDLLSALLELGVGDKSWRSDHHVSGVCLHPP